MQSIIHKFDWLLFSISHVYNYQLQNIFQNFSNNFWINKILSPWSHLWQILWTRPWETSRRISGVIPEGVLRAGWKLKEILNVNFVGNPKKSLHFEECSNERKLLKNDGRITVYLHGGLRTFLKHFLKHFWKNLWKNNYWNIWNDLCWL